MLQLLLNDFCSSLIELIYQESIPKVFLIGVNKKVSLDVGFIFWDNQEAEWLPFNGNLIADEAEQPVGYLDGNINWRWQNLFVEFIEHGV